MPGLTSSSLGVAEIFNTGLGRRLFLALTLVRSKSRALQIEDHILQIRAFVQQCHTLDCSELQKHSADYWRNAHLESEIARKKLQARIDELQNEVKILRDKTVTLKHSKGGTQSKRKSTLLDNNTEEINLPPQKRLHVNGTVTIAPNEESRVQAVLCELELSVPLDLESRYLRQLYILQQSATQTRPVATHLATVLTQLLSSIMNIISDTQNFQSSEITNNKMTRSSQRLTGSPATLLHMVGRTFVYLLRGLDKLCEVTEDHLLWSPIFRELSHLFRETLVLIKTSSVQESISSRQMVQNDQRVLRPRTVTRDPFPVDNQISGQLCRLLITLMASLDTTKPAHQDIIEGVLFYLLDRAGKILKVFVFETENQFDHVKLAETTDATHSEEETTAMEAEVPTLIWILERTIVFLHQHQQRSKQRKPRPSIGVQPTKMNRNSLADHAQRKLQNTLLKAVFGNDTTNLEDRLKEPSYPSYANLEIDKFPPLVGIEDIRSWFKQEVWRIIAWDVIRENITWEKS